MELDEFIELVKEQQGIDLSGVLTTADKIGRPERALEKQAIDDFMKRNPMAGGGRIGFKGGYKVEDMTPEEIKAAQGNARKKGYSGKIGSEEFKNFLANEYRSRAEQLQDFKKLKQKNLKEYQDKFDIDKIKTQTTPLLKSQKDKLFPTYDNIFKEEFARLSSTGDPFSRTDLGRAVVNRIEAENPTINVSKGIGLDKIPGGGNHGSKTIFDIINGRFRKNKLFSKKELALFTQGNETDALLKTKNLQLLFEEILKGDTDRLSLAKKFKVFEERIDGRVEKLMRNLAITNVNDRFTFLKNYKEKDLEKVRNNIYESESLNNSYQRTIVQSVLQSTKLGSKERAQAFEKLEEFNKFKAAMRENGLNPKLLALDHAASYRAIKNGNLKNFLSVTPIMADINTIKSTFDRRSQLNLRRMQEAIQAGDNATYKKFLKNQTELEGIWKTMTGDQSSLGKIRVQPGGKAKGVVKIFDYGATSILEKDKNLINELADNLKIRQNIVNASTPENFQEVSRIMFEGSEAVKPKASILPESFAKLNDPKMFSQEKKIAAVIQGYSKLDKCRIGSMDGGRIGFKFSDECLKDGLNEAKKAAASGDKKAARQLVKTAEVATKGRLLKNILGPGAILGEALFEGALISNRLLEGKPLDQAWAASYLSYLDPRKYSGQLDPTLLQREQMLESTADKDILRSGFAAQDQLSAFNKALQDRELAKARGRTDQYNVAAADAREQGRFADQSADIISSEAFKDASNIAQEYIQGQEGKQRFDLGILGTPRGELSEDRRMFEANKAMKNLYKQYSDDEVRSFLKQSLGTDDDKLIDRYLELTGVTERITPAVTRTLSGLDVLRTGDQIQQATQRIADAGGVANLARGGRAGFKVGKLVKLRKSKVREDVKNIIDDSIKKQEEREFSPNLDLDALIKKTLDEDFLDKKDTIIDTLNAKIARERKNFPYNMQVAEEPSQLEFYDDITKSNFKTKTGEYFDRIRRRNKAGGGLLKQAGDRSGPPPESGPNSQGLQGLLNRGKNI